MDNNKRKKKIVFSEKIDSAINGYAVGISFLLVSAFVLAKDEYFVYPIISYIIGAFLGIIGILGCGTEISKSAKIKGIDNFLVGAIFVGIWLVYYLNFSIIVLNIIMLLFLIVGCYGVVRGIIEIFFSFFYSTFGQSDTISKTEKFKNTFLLLTQIFGFALTILNILKIIGVISPQQG